jgi:hypothetical protein
MGSFRRNWEVGMLSSRHWQSNRLVDFPIDALHAPEAGAMIGVESLSFFKGMAEIEVIQTTPLVIRILIKLERIKVSLRMLSKDKKSVPIY